MSNKPTRETYERRRMEVADFILANPERFDMLSFGYQTACGTVCCLAGTAVVLAEQQGLCESAWDGPLLRGAIPRGKRETEGADVFARGYLGLTTDGVFYNDLGMDEETAAKRLLDEPYVTDKE